MTNLLLLNVPFESDYKDTIYFPNLVQQVNYMKRRRVHTFTDFTYQRKDNIIRIPAHIDTLYNCNYVMYQNEFSKDENTLYNKWMFAFIVDMQYINDERTDVTIKTDVLQTWMFDYTVKPSFVEREHVNDDTIGLHTVPEGLETGEFVCNHKERNRELTYRGILVGATIDLGEYLNHDGWLDGKIPNTTGVMYEGVYSGVNYYYFADASVLNEVLEVVAKNGQSDGITCMFMVPSGFIEVNSSSSLKIPQLVQNEPVIAKEWNRYIDGVDDDVVPSAPENVNGYVPKNNKLLTYPYCYLLADNNSGGAITYHYELFQNRKANFLIYSTVTPGMSIRLIPLNYNGVNGYSAVYDADGRLVLESDKGINNAEGLNLGKFPVCAWTSDVYLNWLTQNGVNIALNTVSGVGQVVAGTALAVASGGLGMAVGGSQIIGGVSSITNQLAQIHQMSLIPPSVQGNVNSGDVTFSSGNLTFTLYQMSIKKEYAQIIDEYLSMFGYKVSRVKIPLANHRKSYWYTKTIDVNIDGAIPNKELQEIKDCYNRGVTFWRSSVVVGDYTADNSIE